MGTKNKAMMSQDEPVNILMVEDNRDDLYLMEIILHQAEYNIISAQSGEEALDLLEEKQSWALMILDLRLPGMDGLQLAREIRRIESISKTPIIFITGMNRESALMLEAYRMGDIDFLFKPVDAETLQSKVSLFAEIYRKDCQIRQLKAQLARTLEETHYCLSL